MIAQVLGDEEIRDYVREHFYRLDQKIPANAKYIRSLLVHAR